MSTLANRPHQALLVIDVQNDVVAEAYDRERIVGNIAALVQKARAQHTPVIWIRHADDELVTGSDAWQIVPELVPLDEEVIIEKNFGDAFEQTCLEEVLRDGAIGSLVVTGAQTDQCVRSTLHGAFVRGYDALLIQDAHTTVDNSKWGAPSPALVIAHTNMYWKYHSAPGRTAGTMTTADLDFAALSF